MDGGSLSDTQRTMVLPLLQETNIRGHPYVTVSSKGIANGLSRYPNDGADFGPDTTKGATAPGQYGSLYTVTNGIMEAKEALPKVKNPATGRLVPSGTIKIIFGGQPIYISEPLQFYDDEFVSVISDDGFTLPIQPPNTPVIYIQNKSSPSIIQILRNPVNSTTPNGILGFDGIVLYNNISSPQGSPATVFKMEGASGNPNPSQLKIGTMGIYDSTGSNGIATISTNGNDDNIQIGNLVAIGGTGVGYNLVNIGVNHLYAELIHTFSLSAVSPSTYIETGSGWMLSIAPGGNAQIDILDCFSYAANGVLDVEASGTQSLTGSKLNINTFYDETSGVVNSAQNAGTASGSSSFRAVTIINNLSSYGQTFQSIAAGFSQYLYLLTAMNSINSSTTDGTTAGTVNMYATLWTPLDRKYTIEFSGYENDTITSQTIAFPSGFTFINTPEIIVNTTGLTITVTTTGITITSPDSTTTYSGIVIVEGY